MAGGRKRTTCGECDICKNKRWAKCEKSKASDSAELNNKTNSVILGKRKALKQAIENIPKKQSMGDRKNNNKKGQWAKNERYLLPKNFKKKN